MKKLIVLLFVVIVTLTSAVFAQSPPYTARVRLATLWWDQYSFDGRENDNDEWLAYVRLDLFDSTGSWIPVSGSVVWWRQDTAGGAYTARYGYGVFVDDWDGEKVKREAHPGVCETCSFEAFNAYAWAIHNGDTVKSDTLRIPDAGVGEMQQQRRFSVTQEDPEGTTVGYFRHEFREEGLAEEPNLGVFYEFPADYVNASKTNAFFTFSETANVGAQQGFVSSTYRFNRWESSADVINHKNFNLQLDNEFTGIAEQTHNATLQSEFNGSPIGGNYVSLKDPWFVDDESHPLGPRNRGMNAEFKPVQYASNNVGVGSQWKGVFLNQSGPGASWQGTYYSVKARSHLFFWPVCSTWSDDEEHPHPSHQGMTYVFTNWSGTNVQFQYSTSDSTPVVFTASGAVVKAVYSLGPPDVPENFAISTYQHGSSYVPKLTWTANNEYNLAGYKLERKIDDGSWSFLATISESATQYIDMTVVTTPSFEAVVYYRLRAYNDEALYSDYTPQQYIGYSELILWERNNQDMAALFEEDLPTTFLLGQNYPNPFNPETEISFGMPEPASVRVTVLDALGREIAFLRDGKFPAGYQRFTWNGRDQNGRQLSSGIYFCRIVATGESGTQFTKVLKMALTK